MTSDKDDFADWYRAVKDDCYRAVLVSIPNADSAADLVAESFARAYANWSSVRQHPAPRAWVLRTTLNLHRDEWRRTRAVALTSLAMVDKDSADVLRTGEVVRVVNDRADDLIAVNRKEDVARRFVEV